MTRKLIFGSVGGRCWCASHPAFAAREVHQFEVFVTIPTQAFYVIPADPTGFIASSNCPGT